MNTAPQLRVVAFPSPRQRKQRRVTRGDRIAKMFNELARIRPRNAQSIENLLTHLLKDAQQENAEPEEY